MQQSRRTKLFTHVIAFTVLTYGLLIVAGSLLRQLRLHPGHDIDALVISLPLLIGISYTYLGSLLLRRKYNAWITAIILSVVTFVLNLSQFHAYVHPSMASSGLKLLLPVCIMALLVLNRQSFQVKSDVRSFRQALQISLVLLAVALLYGVGGFVLLDKHDFHREVGIPTALHQVIDQFGLTTNTLVPYTRRARLFVDSLSVISVTTTAYVVISFFQPLRMRLSNEDAHRQQAEALLREYPADIDDFFKLWPHDKHYFFDKSGRAGLAYHVARGQALVVGDPFGDPKRFSILLTAFFELCFVNDWQAAFIHVTNRHEKLYEQFGLHLQKIGEEAVLDLKTYNLEKNGKYFRQIRNRFTKAGYHVEVLQPPHNEAILARLKETSDEWLTRRGRTERGFLLGYFNKTYLQQCSIAVVYDRAEEIQGFMNLVTTYTPKTANYDLLRCGSLAPGNCNDFLMMGLIEHLEKENMATLNLGLCPLSGVESKAEDATLVDAALRFMYANGDRFYSFNGLRRFKAKYHPAWEDRYIAHSGGVRTFTRVVAALNRAMKVT